MSTGADRSRAFRLGILGGTFDPPHVGHLAAAKAAAKAAELDHVLFVVAGDPWQKHGQVSASAEDRLEMVEALIRGEDEMSASRVEIDRQGPTYTVETLEELSSPEGRRHLPDEIGGRGVDMYLVAGADTAANLHTWRRWTEIPRLARLVVVTRPGERKSEADLPPGSVLADMSPVPVASTDLRRALAKGEMPRGIPEEVAEVIRRRGLYRDRI